jgi:ribosomal protein S18 acetylase RimI-like enzyme
LFPKTWQVRFAQAGQSALRISTAGVDITHPAEFKTVIMQQVRRNQTTEQEKIIMQAERIHLTDAPQITGLAFRTFRGEVDFPHMVEIIEAETLADGDERAVTLDDIKNDYAHLTNSDPRTDMLFAEIEGQPIAYSRVEWFQEDDPNDRIYTFFVNINPSWREKGIEPAMIRWCENRLREIASEHPMDGRRFFQSYSADYKPFMNAILETAGYSPARYFIQMTRSLENIPEISLPEGIDIRPVEEKDIRKIWDAMVEAFRDHWGFSEPKEEDYARYRESKYFQPELWQVAWEGDTVVSSVLNYVDHAQNEKFNRKRGWTEEISTRRPWRRRGIARALIARSMRMHRANGMTEVALGVDTNNPNGALKLYQDLGYAKVRTWITYRKAL